jgi:hypothetical protein
MKYIALILVGTLTACASHEAPPAASADSVRAASNTPSTGPSFAPAHNDGVASAPADTRSPRGTNVAPNTAPSGYNAMTATGPSNNAPGNNGASTNASANSGAATTDTSSVPTNGNAAALPAQSPPTSDYAADNTRVNARDRNGSTLTPMDQGSSEADRKLTQQIRQAVVADKSLSFTAKNVKIITINGKVTLRGAVKTDDERTKIAAAAKRIAGDAQVENYLEVAK